MEPKNHNKVNITKKQTRGPQRSCYQWGEGGGRAQTLRYKISWYTMGIQPLFYNSKWSISFKIVTHYTYNFHNNIVLQ